MRRNRRSQKGVTLVEMIMAIVILSLIGIPMGLMIGEQIQGMMTSGEFTTAGNLARFEMEKLNNLPFASVTSGSSTYPGYPYTVTRTVTTTTGGGGASLKDITVTVTRTGEPSPIVTIYSSIVNNVTYAP